MPQDESTTRSDELELLRRWLLTEDEAEEGRVSDEQYHVMEDAVVDAFGPEASLVLAEQLKDVHAKGPLADVAADPARLHALLDAILAARPPGWLERKSAWPQLPAGEYYWSAERPKPDDTFPAGAGDHQPPP